MATKMTRKKALEIAQEAIKSQMLIIYPKVFTDEIAEAVYAELAAALAMIEHMARQGELHL